MKHVGQQYGIYKILERLDTKSNDGHTMYRVRCTVCNKIIVLPSNAIIKGSRVPTTCRHDKYNITRIKNKRLRNIFAAMIKRCYWPQCKNYRIYGGKGVYIYDEWLADPHEFEIWSKSHGYTKTMTIDRLDSDGPYAPWNCRWVSKSINSKYKSTTNLYQAYDTIDSGKGWSRRLNLSSNYINKFANRHGKELTERFIRDKCDGFTTLIPRK